MPVFDNNHERELAYVPKGVNIMQRIAAIALILVLLASTALALTLPGTETGYVTVKGSKQTVSVVAEVRYTHAFTQLPTLYINVNRKTGPKKPVQPFTVLSESLTGFTVRMCPAPDTTMCLTWTARQKVYTTSKGALYAEP